MCTSNSFILWIKHSSSNGNLLLCWFPGTRRSKQHQRPVVVTSDRSPRMESRHHTWTITRVSASPPSSASHLSRPDSYCSPDRSCCSQDWTLISKPHNKFTWHFTITKTFPYGLHQEFGVKVIPQSNTVNLGPNFNFDTTPYTNNICSRIRNLKTTVHESPFVWWKQKNFCNSKCYNDSGKDSDIVRHYQGEELLKI